MRLKRRNVEVIAETENEIKRYIAQGYEPLEAVQEKKLEPADYENMSVKELRALAAERGFISKALKKQELIEILEG